MPTRMRMHLIALIFLLLYAAPGGTMVDEEVTEEAVTTTIVQETTVSELTTVLQKTTAIEETTLQTTEQTTAVGSEPSTEQSAERTTGVTTRDYQEDNVAERNIENICLTDDPCKGENVRCVAGKEGAECICNEGFQLEGSERQSCNDVDECLQSPCNSDAHERCINIHGSYTCVCQEGYLQNNVNVCEDIDECLTELCDNNQHCVNTGGSYDCSCNRGYKLASSGSCLDINECGEDLDNCHLFENTDCYNTEGTFACICKEGYVEDSNDVCKRAIDGCQSDFSSNCQYPEGYCMVDEDRNQKCICSPGFIRNKTSNLCTNNNECLESIHVCEKTANSHCVDVVPSVSNSDEFYRCECNEGYAKGRTGTCLKVATFRLSLLVLAVNGKNASSLWSANLQESTSKKFSEVSNLFCSFFQEYLADDSANMTSCSGLAVKNKDSDLKVALQMNVVSNSRSLNADTLEFVFIDASTLDHNGAFMWIKSNGDSIVVSSSSFDVELTDHINCSALECFNGGTCVFDEKFYEIFCRCQEDFEGDQCENKKRELEETIDQNQEDNSPKVDQNYPLIIGVSIASVVLLTLFITLCCLLQRSNNQSHWKAQSLADIPHIVRNPIVRRRPVQKSEVSDQEEPNYDDIRMNIFAKTFSRMGYLKTQEDDDEKSSEDSGSLATFEFSVPYQTDGSMNV